MDQGIQHFDPEQQGPWSRTSSSPGFRRLHRRAQGTDRRESNNSKIVEGTCSNSGGTLRLPRTRHYLREIRPGEVFQVDQDIQAQGRNTKVSSHDGLWPLAEGAADSRAHVEIHHAAPAGRGQGWSGLPRTRNESFRNGWKPLDELC